MSQIVFPLLILHFSSLIHVIACMYIHTRISKVLNSNLWLRIRNTLIYYYKGQIYRIQSHTLTEAHIEYLTNRMHKWWRCLQVVVGVRAS